MRNDITEYLKSELRRRCESHSNKFGIGIYDHIKAVAKNAEQLSRQLGADEEITVIAAGSMISRRLRIIICTKITISTERRWQGKY